MTTKEFEQEIKQLDDGFSIVENPNRPGLSNIFWRGQNYDLPAVSSYEVKDEPDPTYTYEFPNGMTARFWSKADVIPRLKSFLESMKTDEFKELYS